MSFYNVLQFPEQFWLYVGAQVDDWPAKAVVLRGKEMQQMFELLKIILQIVRTYL